MAPMPPAAGFVERRQESHPVIAGLAVSSLELDSRSSVLTARDAASTTPTSTFIPGQGSKPPEAFNNHFFLILFALIGTAMVLGSLWFFFWAKNGGFHFQQGDWDDYKSTVLRRKGPDGKTLSNATKSTKLGGSTIAGTQHYKWQKHVAKSVVGRDEKGRKGILGKRGWAKTHSILYSDDYMTDSFATQTVTDMTEVRTEPDYSNHKHSKRYRDRELQDYKREKPARVGGLNRVADGSHFTGSNYIGSETQSEAEQPMLQKSPNQKREKERAERKAREEAARMERRWKREAEEAAAALARESSSRPPPPPAHTSTRRSAAPAKPSPSKQRSSSRSASPKKRDFSYQAGPASEVLSTAYTPTNASGTRVSSYYDEYRPRAAENPRYSSDRSRQSSPTKKGGARQGRREGGYRRGADSDLD